MPKLVTATSNKPRPHFASHTQSSLMKTRTPMKLKKLSLAKNANESKTSQKSVILRLNGIYKRRSVTKQSRSMQMLITILKQQRDHHATILLPGGELMGTTCQLENSLASFQSDLIKDVSHDLKKCVGSPTRLSTLCGEPTKAINDSFSAEDLHASSQDGINRAERDNSNDTHDSSETRAIIDVTYKLQLHLSDEKESPDSRSEDKDCRTESRGKTDDLPNNDCSKIETQVLPQDANIATSRKRMRRTWTLRKAATRNEQIDFDHVYRTDLQGSKSTKYADTVVNSSATIRKRSVLQKNLASNQRAWRPPGTTKTSIAESATSLQPISQKSSQSTEKSTSIKSKYSSTQYIKSFNSDSTSTSISTNQSKMLMKENRDPCMTKTCEYLVEPKQRLQSGGTLPRKKQSRTKIGTKVLDKHNDINPTLPKSKSRHCQTQSIMPKESANNSSNIERQHTESTLIYNRSRTLEVIHTLRKIIDNIRENDNAEENAVKNNDCDHEKNDNEIQTSSNSDTSQNNELYIFTKDVNLDETDQSRKSISTQTKLDSSSCHKIDAEKDQDLTEILNLTRIVATQTLPNWNRNVVEIGCNTSNIICNDVEVSCDLICPTNLKTEVAIKSTMTEELTDKSMSNVPIYTEHLSGKHTEINIENEDTNENKNLLLYKKTLDKLKMSLTLENCDDMEILAKTTNDAVAETEKIVHEKACQIYLKPFKNSDDKTNTDKNQESAKWSICHNINSTSVSNLFLESSRSSISDNMSCSSEEEMEYLENGVQGESIASKLKMDYVPSDVIAAFKLAAERARNLHEAVIIYNNLMSRESGKQNEDTEDNETSEFRNKQNYPEKYTSFVNREDEDKIKSECEVICHFANNGEDFGGFSSCSSCGCSSDEICGRSSKDYDFGVEREEESVILSGSRQAIARSILNERSDLKNVKSLMQLLMRPSQEKYALELLKLNRNDESFEMERMKSDKIWALPMATNKTSIISRGNLFPFICCIVCTVVFWFLQFLFRCDSTK